MMKDVIRSRNGNLNIICGPVHWFAEVFGC